MTRRLAARPADPETGAYDSAKCPRGCGDDLVFRSNSLLGGVTESCCPTCGTPWTAIPRRRLVAPPVDTIGVTAEAPLRTQVLAALPETLEDAVESGPFCAQFGPRASTAERVLAGLRLEGLVESEGRGARRLVWRAA
jgi:hypothetical protein